MYLNLCMYNVTHPGPEKKPDPDPDPTNFLMFKNYNYRKRYFLTTYFLLLGRPTPSPPQSNFFSPLCHFTVFLVKFKCRPLDPNGVLPLPPRVHHSTDRKYSLNFQYGSRAWDLLLFYTVTDDTGILIEFFAREG